MKYEATKAKVQKPTPATKYPIGHQNWGANFGPSADCPRNASSATTAPPLIRSNTFKPSIDTVMSDLKVSSACSSSNVMSLGLTN